VRCCAYAEGELSLTEIWAGADPPNAESFRVMERLGLSFREELVIGGRTARYFATSVIT
jgi:RimJ/RimL family protein N-acetyltransferase